MLRVEHDGRATQVANLSAFVLAHPVAHPNPGDFEPYGTWYSMVADGDRLCGVEPNHGEVDVVTPPDGAIRRLVDVFRHPGSHRTYVTGTPRWRLPTGQSRSVRAGCSSSGRSAASNQWRQHQASSNWPDCGHRPCGKPRQIYALEAFTGFFAPTPDVANTGMVVRLNSRTITWEPVVTGLSFPTAMTFDGNGDLFISNKGFGQPTNTAGEIVKVALAASGSESHPLPPRAATACTGIAAGRGATAARAIATHCRQHLQLPDEILHRSTAANCVAQPVRGTADLGVQFGRSGLSLRRRSGRLHIHDHQHGDERPDQSAGRICTAERTGLRKRKQPGRYQSSHRIRRVVAGERTGRGGIDAVVGVRHGCRSLPIDERHVCRRQ